MRSKILIIAEAGINHNGQLNKAIELMQEAKKIGADIIKFQTFKAENTVIPNARKAKYQITKKNNHETQYSLLKKLELSYSDFKNSDVPSFELFECTKIS